MHVAFKLCNLFAIIMKIELHSLPQHVEQLHCMCKTVLVDYQHEWFDLA